MAARDDRRSRDRGRGFAQLTVAAPGALGARGWGFTWAIRMRWSDGRPGTMEAWRGVRATDGGWAGRAREAWMSEFAQLTVAARDERPNQGHAAGFAQLAVAGREERGVVEGGGAGGRHG